MTEKITILACQIEVPNFSDVETKHIHNQRVAGLIDASLTNTHCDLVVLPELSNMDYSQEAFENLEDLAETDTGPTFEVFSKLAKKHKTTIAYGFAKLGDNCFYISQMIVGPDGNKLGRYDKIHLAHFGASYEKNYFHAGKGTITFEVAGFKIAPIICYDIRFPELTNKLTVDDGAHIILHCGAYAQDPSFYSWHPFAITRALENQVYLLSLNRAGENYGQSLFCEPWVDNETQPFQFNDGEQLKTFELTKEQVYKARDKYTFLKDRRPKSY